MRFKFIESAIDVRRDDNPIKLIDSDSDFGDVRRFDDDRHFDDDRGIRANDDGPLGSCRSAR